MSRNAKRFTAIKSAKVNTVREKDAEESITIFMRRGEPCVWDLTQEDAEWISKNRATISIKGLVKALKERGITPGGRYIGCRVLSGADPDLCKLARDWRAHKNIVRELSGKELSAIGAVPSDLRHLGITTQRGAREFYSLYCEVMKPWRVFRSSKQVPLSKVKAVSTTANYNRLPLWVKRTMIQSGNWIETDRIGNIWRFLPCAKAWKHAPNLAKNIAEKVGKMSPKTRILAHWAWDSVCGDLVVSQLRGLGWRKSREALVHDFWLELKRLQSLSLADLIIEKSLAPQISDRSKLRILAEMVLDLPHKYLEEVWGDSVDGSCMNYLHAVRFYGDPRTVCKEVFGSSGPATLKAFQDLDRNVWKDCNAWRWAAAICDRNPDAAQKILQMKELVPFSPEAVPFLKSLPMQSRIRLLAKTEFQYRGDECLVTVDHVRDVGYLWKNVKNMPDLGRLRCWFSIHERLSAAFVKELPDESLPVTSDWSRIDGLCSVDRLWSLEIPRNVETLKLYGETLKNCVGGYGPAIKSGRSVIVAVREQGVLTHCVEVCGVRVMQFYRERNTKADENIKTGVEDALRQACLLM